MITIAYSAVAAPSSARKGSAPVRRADRQRLPSVRAWLIKRNGDIECLSA
jgi:hypothetical protein